MKITIPASIEEATEQLNGIHSLLTATEWEKAAIVAAFVDTPGKGKSTDLYSTHAFAALKITGLSSAVTVQRYVNAWESTGLPKPVIGEDVELPTIDFPVSTPALPANDSSPEPKPESSEPSEPESQFAPVLSRLDLMTPEELEAHEKQVAEWDAETPEWENPITPMRKSAEAMGAFVAIEHAFDAAMLVVDDIQTEFDKDVAVAALVTIKNKLEILHTMIVSETPNDISSLIN